jgi:alpha-glucosidase
LQQAQATLDASKQAGGTAAGATSITPAERLEVRSPDGKIEVLFGLVDGVPYYSLNRADVSVILPSKLGFTFLNDAPLEAGLRILDWEQTSFDETWTQPWGEVKEIRNHYNELRIRLSDGALQPRQFSVIFRVFDDGLGFRYELPEQPSLGELQITNELTEFAMGADHQAWWIEAYQDNRYEYLYRQTPISFLPILARSGVHTPLTMQTNNGLYLSIHEAALTQYASMTLKADENMVLHADLVPWSDGVKVKGHTPLVTPWRTIQVAENPGDLITSYLILNLNEPNALGDVSWVRPGKYVGIWWGMHLDKWTWGSGPKHGATTRNTRAYLDFAAENGFAGVLVEGWNLGWDGDWTANGELFNFTTPYPDFDLPGLAAYAAARDVALIGHHETAAAIANYESQLEAAFALYQSLGINTVKTGYVGWGQGIERYDEQGNLVGLEWHHGQFMVEHHQKVVVTAAKYGIMIDAHEPVKDTGLRRTYPNSMTREGARGQEYNAWGAEGGNPPDHVTILPFTRLLAGPMDYTPGILALTFPEFKPNNRINHTLAKELALYVVIYSPLQMAADLIENYEANPAFQFIRDVPADWHETRVLHAQIGDFITTVRREREGDEWFLGSITDEEARQLETTLDFLTPGMTYVAEIYSDGEGADWETNPYVLDIDQYLVDSTTLLNLDLAPGGGQAIRFYPASAEEAVSLPGYQP